MEIETLVVGDNFTYLILDRGRAAVVDPGCARPVQEALTGRGAVLDLILVTHHHGDHTAGCVALRQTYDCRIAGPADGHGLIDQPVGSAGGCNRINGPSSRRKASMSG